MGGVITKVDGKKSIPKTESAAQAELAVAFSEQEIANGQEDPNQDPHMADVNTDTKLDNKNTNKTDKTDKTGKKIKDGKKTDKKGMSAWLIISLCILGALLIAGAVWFFVFRTSEEDEEFNAEQEC